MADKGKAALDDDADLEVFVPYVINCACDIQSKCRVQTQGVSPRCEGCLKAISKVYNLLDSFKNNQSATSL